MAGGSSVELSADELAARLAPFDVHDIRRLSGGASSLTYTGTIPAHGRVVVKVAPAGVPPTLNRDVLRQSRLLRALQGTAVPVPQVLAEDPGTPPHMPPLFVMDFVDGTSLEPLFDLAPADDDTDDDPPTVAERMRSAARTLAALHAVAPASIGLAGEPVVGPADEVERWCRLLQTVDPQLAPGWQDVANTLRATEPPPLPAAVVHGDFRLGNTLAVGRTITAIIDWEIWSIADPRIDLGWFLVNAAPETYRRPTPYTGSLPTPEELTAIYAPAGVPHLPWFQALACFKSTATWSLIVKHNRRRPTPDPDLEAMSPSLPHLLAHAHTFLTP
jgi:aminoglycoside phosphotransferase (APT) family kinase protein